MVSSLSADEVEKIVREGDHVYRASCLHDELIRTVMHDPEFNRFFGPGIRQRLQYIIESHYRDSVRQNVKSQGLLVMMNDSPVLHVRFTDGASGSDARVAVYSCRQVGQARSALAYVLIGFVGGVAAVAIGCLSRYLWRATLS